MSIEMIASEMDNHSEECIYNNLIYMEKCGMIDNNDGKYKMTPYAKKLLVKSK